MDLVTAAITAALGTFSNASIGEVAKRTVSDAYDALKRQVAERFGETSEAARLVADVRPVAPESSLLAYPLQRLEQLQLVKDPEIAKAAEALNEAIKTGTYHVDRPSVHVTVGGDGTFIGIGQSNGPTNVNVDGISR